MKHIFFLFLCLTGAELHLMFSLMDKVPSGIEPMLKDLEEHIINAGLADMVAAAETITTVGAQAHSLTISQLVTFSSYMWLWWTFHVFILQTEV